MAESDSAINLKLREAIEELMQYLSDTVPPLVVAEAIKVLLKYPPELVAAQIHAWTTMQYRDGSEIPLSDYLFHAVKKIHMLGDFRLVPREPFENYLEGLKGLVLSYCPEGDREILRTNLGRLSETTASVSSPIEVVFRQQLGRPRGAPATVAGAAAASSVLASGADLPGLRQVSMLVDRLEQEIQRSPDPQSVVKKGPLASQALAAAARSQSSVDLDRILDRLRHLGVEVGTGDVLRSLSNSLPGWLPPSPPGRALGEAPHLSSATVEAMRRVVTESGDPAEGARRFYEMVKAAVERFNEGSLPQAITMLELAERIIKEGEVDPAAAEAVRGKADEGIDMERLRKYAEAPYQHALLCRVLNFFVGLMPDGLLNSLQKELKRERRRLILLLLEVHGLPARQAAFERLNASPGEKDSDGEWYFRRNLLYLLRRIPRSEYASVEDDLGVAIRFAELRYPAPLVKEAIANLGQIKHDRAEKTLVALLRNLETMLSKAEDAPYDPREMRLLLDRVVAALARFGTPGSRRAVVDHGLKEKKEFGETMSRLAELAGQDLSGEQDSIDKLLAIIKENTPFKLFGLVLHQNDQNLYYCIEALSTTPHPAVQEAFRNIVKRFPGQEVAKAAAKALAAFASTAPAATSAAGASLTGDLELFGLPALLQSFAEARISGALTLRDPKGEVYGSLTLRGGKLATCRTGRLSGEEAFYQLLERPLPGNFLFARQADSPPDEKSPLKEVLPLILEGMRRYDEFQQAATLVPDDMMLKSTNVKPTPHPDERDGILFKDLWLRVAQSATPLQCEADIRADSYRVRRLLAHWVERGVLVAS